MDDPPGGRRPTGAAFTIDRAAFLLLRVKRAFKKKKQQKKEKSPGGESGGGRPAPLSRSRTLPAIVVPGLILRAQIDPHGDAGEERPRRLRPSFQCDRSTPRASLVSAPDLERAEIERSASRTSGTRSCRLSPNTSQAAPPGLRRLVRLLSTAPTTAFARPPSPPSFSGESVVRRLSWERRDSAGVARRSSSIDSLAEIVWTASPVPFSEPSPPPCSTPSDGRRAKSQRGVGEATPPHESSKRSVLKMSKKQSKQIRAQLDKLAKINIHLHALFAAVEHNHLEKARTILESTDVDVNSSNSDGLSPLDIAVLGNDAPLARMLMSFGARQGSRFKTSEALGDHLQSLCAEAEDRVRELVTGGCVFGSVASINFPPTRVQSGTSSTTGCAGQGSDREKQLRHWERRAKFLNRMLLGWRQTMPPDAPCVPELDVTSPTSVTVRIREDPARRRGLPMITKYRVEWSARGDFSNVCGNIEVAAAVPLCSNTVTGLTRGRRYFFRAQGGNFKGWGPYAGSAPDSVLPSSWRDIEGRVPRFEGRLVRLERLTAAAGAARWGPSPQPLPPSVPAQRSRRPRHAIRHLFAVASKFHKNLRRGAYFASIIYHEDKVLVTNEDFLPVIEIDETYPACIHGDYHWFMKVSYSWESIKVLKSDLEKNSSSAVHFRIKLLNAAAQMQSALCIQELGQLYHKPLRDDQGTIVISCVASVKSLKSISALNLRWLPLSKVQKKLSILNDDNSIGDILMGTIQDQINYHQLSSVRLPRGLYMGYLKLQSSVDQIQIVVPSKAPNVLPYCKMRENSHVSGEEWDHLKRRQSAHSDNRPETLLGMSHLGVRSPTESQRVFLESVISTAKKIFKHMDVSPEDALAHRIYDAEVIDLSEDVSFIVVCPPAERACSIPGQKEILLQRGDFLSLSIQAFEMIHLDAYQPDIVDKYSKLSCALELDTIMANHSHREAFSNAELQAAKDKLSKLQELQSGLNSIWKESRWLMDAIGFARDRDRTQKNKNAVGIQIKNLFGESAPVAYAEEESGDGAEEGLLRPPSRDPRLVKSSPGRGSWPGPNATNAVDCSGGGRLTGELSKSEQHLSTLPHEDSASSFDASGSQYLSAASDTLGGVGDDRRRARIDDEVGQVRLPPSRSQDTLLRRTSAQTKRRKSVDLESSASTRCASPLRPESARSASSDSDGQSRTANGPAHRRLVDVERHPSSGSVTSVDSRCEFPSARNGPDSSSSSSGILQVFAAYETGLAVGTSLKLHVTPRTTAREVVDLVVKQLNMAVALKGRDGPVYTGERLENFCLVAVIGARERCLRDDFRPLQLQNPWRKGRLYVRQKHEVLAALEHSGKRTDFV